MSRHPVPASRSGSDPQGTRLRTRCPHCGTYAKVRTSYAITAIYSELRFECTNDACGHVWIASLAALRTLCPSDIPNSEIQLPLTARRASSVPNAAEPAARQAAG